MTTPQGPADARHSLSFEQALPRSLAHRWSLAEVYIADTMPAGADEFLVAIQIPRAHSLWFDRLAAYHDPLSTVEAIRQALIVIGQRHLRVPNDATGSLQRVEFCVEDLSSYRDNEKSPLEGVARIRFDHDGGSVNYYSNLSFEATLTIDNIRALTLRGGLIAFPREAYEDLRRLHQRQRLTGPITMDNPPAPLDPSLVGRRDPRNVVIGWLDDTSDAARKRFALITDQRHPYFFDHPYDHVPAPLLLEAIRQTAIVAAHSSGVLDSPVAAVTGAHVEFTGYAELDRSIALYANVDKSAEFGDFEVAVSLCQFGQQIADGRVELSPYPS